MTKCPSTCGKTMWRWDYTAVASVGVDKAVDVVPACMIAQYFSDLTPDQQTFFMDKVEKELRDTEEYNAMLDALGATIDNVRCSGPVLCCAGLVSDCTCFGLVSQKFAADVAALTERDSNTKTKVRTVVARLPRTLSHKSCAGGADDGQNR